MRRLGLSLILLVLVSLFALGWLGDRLFGPESTPEDNSVQLAREVTAMLAETLANSMIGVEELTMSSPTPGYSLVLMEKESLSLPQELQTQLDVDGSLTLATRSQLTVYHQVSEGGALLALSQPQDTAQQIPLKLSLTLLFYIALCALLLLWVYPLMARLKRLTTAAKVIGQGDFSHKVATSSSSSLYTIESEFNRMSQRIQSLLEDNRLLSGAVSHDLRTPLARLRFGIDALQEQQHNEISDGYLKRISQDLDAMEQLVGVLLEFVQLDRQLDELPLESVDLCDVLTDCLNATDIQDKIKVSADIDDQQHYVMGEERFTRMVVNNLIGNAINHASSQVVVSVVDRDGLTWLHVEDDGAGFGDEDPQRLLKPFERGTAQTKNFERSSYGLGLAIVKRITDWYAASLELKTSDKLGGAKVCVGFNTALAPLV